MTSIDTLSVTQAASKVFEILEYGEYEKDKAGEHTWREPFSGTFQEYLDYNYLAKYDYDDEESITDLDIDRIWQNYHGEDGAEATRDGLTAKVVESYGGEGGGDQYWMVISLSDRTTARYFRRDGWYASYDGGYLDGETYEVNPSERTVVFYE